MSKLLGALACLALTVCVVVASHNASAAEKNAAPDDFSGKILVVETIGGSSAALLSEVRLRDLGGRPFLAGKSLAETGAGRIWIPVDNVTRISEFDKLDDATKFMRLPQ